MKNRFGKNALLWTDSVRLLVIQNVESDLSVIARSTLGMKLNDSYLCFGFNIYIILQQFANNWYVPSANGVVEGSIAIGIYNVGISPVHEKNTHAF